MIDQRNWPRTTTQSDNSNVQKEDDMNPSLDVFVQGLLDSFKLDEDDPPVHEPIPNYTTTMVNYDRLQESGELTTAAKSESHGKGKRIKPPQNNSYLLNQTANLPCDSKIADIASMIWNHKPLPTGSSNREKNVKSLRHLAASDSQEWRREVRISGKVSQSLELDSPAGSSTSNTTNSSYQSNRRTRSKEPSPDNNRDPSRSRYFRWSEANGHSNNVQVLPPLKRLKLSVATVPVQQHPELVETKTVASFIAPKSSLDQPSNAPVDVNPPEKSTSIAVVVDKKAARNRHLRDDHLDKQKKLVHQLSMLRRQQAELVHKQQLCRVPKERKSLENVIIEKARLQKEVTQSAGSLQKIIEKYTKLLKENLNCLDRVNGSVQYRFFDPGQHWCTHCDLILDNLNDYLVHLHSVAHQSREMVDGMSSPPWRKNDAVHKRIEKIDQVDQLDRGSDLVPLGGLQCLKAADAWYCDACHVWLGDVQSVESHMSSDQHSNGFLKWSMERPQWEMEHTIAKQRALDRHMQRKTEEKKKMIQQEEDVASTQPAGSTQETLLKHVEPSEKRVESSIHNSTVSETNQNHIEDPNVNVPDVEDPNVNAPDAEDPIVNVPNVEDPDANVRDAENPNFNAPDAEDPNANAPDAEDPDVNVPDVKDSNVNDPDVEDPNVNVPDAEDPAVNVADAEDPDVNDPDAEDPDVKDPNVNTPYAENQDFTKNSVKMEIKLENTNIEEKKEKTEDVGDSSHLVDPDDLLDETMPLILPSDTDYSFTAVTEAMTEKSTDHVSAAVETKPETSTGNFVIEKMCCLNTKKERQKEDSNSTEVSVHLCDFIVLSETGEEVDPSAEYNGGVIQHEIIDVSDEDN